MSLRVFCVVLTLEMAGAGFACAHESADLTRLPLGDGKISTGPKTGFIWACRSIRTPAAPFATGRGSTRPPAFGSTGRPR